MAEINVAICVGCDTYDHMGPLKGAVADSKRIFDALLTGTTLYDPGQSSHLVSPTLSQLRESFDALLKQKSIRTFTVYFAGHGAIKAGTFYLCLRDSDDSRLSTSALPAAELFAIIGEAGPQQANVIIDACQAGGAMFDLHALMKPEVIGSAEGSSVACLAAAASDQYAGESDEGGVATMALVKYLSGEKKIQDGRPYLNLIEVGLEVSRDVQAQEPSQNPVAWGLNLYGEGIFANNPHYFGQGSGPLFSVEGISPTSAAGSQIQRHSESLWSEYRAIVADHDSKRLYETLTGVRRDVAVGFPEFLRGYASALATRAVESMDVLAASDALSVALVTLLPSAKEKRVEPVLEELLTQKAQVDFNAVTELVSSLGDNKHFLLSSPLADLHYLPIRVSRLLAWIALARRARSATGLPDEGFAGRTSSLVRLIFDNYSESLIAVSDEQAAATYIFASSAEQCGWGAEANVLLDHLFTSAVKVNGLFSAAEASGDGVLRYTLTRAGVSVPLTMDDLSNPTELLAVLLMLGHHRKRASEWDPMVKAFDGRVLNAYVPKSYLSFGDDTMNEGRNYTLRVGFGIWTVEDYGIEFEKTVLPHVQTAATDLSPLARLISAVASYVLPDRVPYCLDPSIK